MILVAEKGNSGAAYMPRPHRNNSRFLDFSSAKSAKFKLLQKIDLSCMI
jgi:hypothetical protein